MSDTEQALRALWALWNDAQWCGYKADYLKGHLSYANMLEEKERDIRRALAVPEQAPETPEMARLHHDEQQVDRKDVEPGMALPCATSADSSPRPDHGNGERSGANGGTVAEVRGSAAPAALPDGIPREPTEAMCEAGARSIIDGNESRPGTSWAEEARYAWRAMIDAAIQAQTEGERAPSPASASAVPQGGDAAANQGGER